LDRRSARLEEALPKQLHQLQTARQAQRWPSGSVMVSGQSLPAQQAVDPSLNSALLHRCVSILSRCDLPLPKKPLTQARRIGLAPVALPGTKKRTQPGRAESSLERGSGGPLGSAGERCAATRPSVRLRPVAMVPVSLRCRRCARTSAWLPKRFISHQRRSGLRVRLRSSHRKASLALPFAVAFSPSLGSLRVGCRPGSRRSGLRVSILRRLLQDPRS